MRKLRSAVIAASLALAFVAKAEPLSCRAIEVEVAGIDTTGAIHPAFNFAMGLPVGKTWSRVFDGEAATLKVSITWENEINRNAPKIFLTVTPKDKAAVEGSVVLELLVWDSLCGPEPVLTRDQKPFALPGIGSLFAVAAVSPVECGATDG